MLLTHWLRLLRDRFEPVPAYAAADRSQGHFRSLNYQHTAAAHFLGERFRRSASHKPALKNYRWNARQRLA